MRTKVDPAHESVAFQRHDGYLHHVHRLLRSRVDHVGEDVKWEWPRAWLVPKQGGEAVQGVTGDVHHKSLGGSLLPYVCVMVRYEDHIPILATRVHTLKADPAHGAEDQYRVCSKSAAALLRSDVALLTDQAVHHERRADSRLHCCAQHTYAVGSRSVLLACRAAASWQEAHWRRSTSC